MASQAAVPPGGDSTGLILERLKAHGAKHTRYIDRGEVARGGMGMILRVWDEDLRRELAMKVVLGEDGLATTRQIAPKMLGRFLEEAQVTGQLDHPGIVPVHELGVDERGAVFFTMRLVKGRDLKEIFDLVHKGDANWTQTRVLWALLKMCDALAYAHSKGVIHRDLKPANVMVGRFGEVYVMDWGLARVLGQPDRHDLRFRTHDTSIAFVQSERRLDASHSADSVLFTMDGDVVGTPAYMAPEQARGEIERLGARSDVYSVGAMLYHLLTGEMPFVAPGAKMSQHMVLRSALEGPPKPLRTLAPGAPEELVSICEKAMAREPEQRYADMGELGEDLRAYLENRVVKAYRRGAWVEFVKWVQRNRALALAWSAAIVVALAGLGTTAFVQIRGRRVAEIAQREAVLNEAEARHQEAIARRERLNVMRLSASQELGDLVRAADDLWPATAARVPAMQDWMTRAERLIAGLEPSASGDPGHRAQLAELLSRAVPLAPEERTRMLATHPRGVELERAEREVAALAAAAAVRSGKAQPAEFELDSALSTASAAELNGRAYALIDPAHREFGREAEALALARAALERSEPTQRHPVLDTVAWASLAVGLDDEALAASREALESSKGSQEYEEYLMRVTQSVEFARGPRSGEMLAQARARLAGLEREVFGWSLPRFANEDDRWWYGQLAALVAALEDFADPKTGLVHGFSPAHGWGMEKRIAFASALEERTLTGAAARAAWEAALADIADPARCPAYSGLSLRPQLGLLPLGRDPRSGLHEFADVATGEPPRRDESGHLEIGPGSSVVFVLLPGGAFELGAQSEDPGLANYDPAADPSEGPVQSLRLAPFFLSKYELTQGQWKRFSGRNPSLYLSGAQDSGRPLTDRSPVERVSWFEAERELGRLGWLLPTEAQWEYAARAGVGAPWWTGEEFLTLDGAENLSDRFAHAHQAPWPSFQDELDDGNFVHALVGSFDANPFGFYDVIGNLHEWCRDTYGEYQLAINPGDGLRLGGDPGTRIVRGGSFVMAAKGARVAKRNSATAEFANESLGVRPMRALDP